MFATDSKKCGKGVFNCRFEIIRTRWSSRAHQSNQSHNEKISKAVPAPFKIPRTLYISISIVITHWEKLLDSDWLRDCEFMRNLRANSVIRGKLQDLKGKICNSFRIQIQKRVND